MIKRYAVQISPAIECALNLDDVGIRRAMRLPDPVRKARRGSTFELTLEEIERLAFHMTRDSGWDLAPSTIAACNKRARQLRAFATQLKVGAA